jgi:hypothetical protein
VAKFERSECVIFMCWAVCAPLYKHVSFVLLHWLSSRFDVYGNSAVIDKKSQPLSDSDVGANKETFGVQRQFPPLFPIL